MAKQQLGDSAVRKLTRTGGGKSVSVVLPIELVRELGWRDKQKVDVVRRGDTLVIRDWKA